MPAQVQRPYLSRPTPPSPSTAAPHEPRAEFRASNPSVTAPIPASPVVHTMHPASNSSGPVPKTCSLIKSARPGSYVSTCEHNLFGSAACACVLSMLTIILNRGEQDEITIEKRVLTLRASLGTIRHSLRRPKSSIQFRRASQLQQH